MGLIKTFPSEADIQRYAAATPEYMRPSLVPYAVIFEGILSDEECIEIEQRLGGLEPYVVPGCNAVTRECISDPSLDMIEKVARSANDWYFNFDLDPDPVSWLQTYKRDSKYQRHMDAAPGQTRKLTAVALLSDPLRYDGGDLTLYVAPKRFVVPKTRGTIVVFQHWVEHDVSVVDNGFRKTINMGFWGPPFH